MYGSVRTRGDSRPYRDSRPAATARLGLGDASANGDYQCRVSLGLSRQQCCGAVMRAFDPQETLAVHCGNGFNADFSPYQSARLRR